MITTKEKKMCFVITPIGDNNSDIRRHIDGIIDQAIMPALGDKYDIIVAHRKYEIGSINEKVIRSVFEAELVIANLTNTNPNVMYELAIRHSFGKPAIVIAEKDTKLPFDVIDENTIFYINDPAGANDLKEKLIEFEKSITYEEDKYGPVYKVISKIPLYKEVESGENVSNDKALQYVIDRLDSLEKNINLKTINTTNKLKCQLKFMKDENFDGDEITDIINIIWTYDSMNSMLYKNDDSFVVNCTLENNSQLKNLVDDLNQYIRNRKISFHVHM